MMYPLRIRKFLSYENQNSSAYLVMGVIDYVWGCSENKEPITPQHVYILADDLRVVEMYPFINPEVLK